MLQFAEFTREVPNRLPLAKPPQLWVERVRTVLWMFSG